MPWVLRGLREGVVTTPYPRRPDGYGESFRAAVSVHRQDAPAHGREIVELCPTGAIAIEDDTIFLHRDRCILCGRCVAADPARFAFEENPETATIGRRPLVVPPGDGDEEGLVRLRRDLARRVRAFRRSVHIRHVDAGSDGSEEWEVAALLNPVYDVQRLGIHFTASPRHADMLLVTGAGSVGMAGPLRRTYEAMPHPKVVIAAGVDAASGGLAHPTYATTGGVEAHLPVDVYVPGSPPSPFSLLHGILLAIGLVETGATR